MTRRSSRRSARKKSARKKSARKSTQYRGNIEPVQATFLVKYPRDGNRRGVVTATIQGEGAPVSGFQSGDTIPIMYTSLIHGTVATANVTILKVNFIVPVGKNVVFHIYIVESLPD